MIAIIVGVVILLILLVAVGYYFLTKEDDEVPPGYIPGGDGTNGDDTNGGSDNNNNNNGGTTPPPPVIQTITADQKMKINALSTCATITLNRDGREILLPIFHIIAVNSANELFYIDQKASSVKVEGDVITGYTTDGLISLSVRTDGTIKLINPQGQEWNLSGFLGECTLPPNPNAS